MQSGLYWGYLGLVDGILGRILDEMADDTTVIATGDFASILCKDSAHVGTIDPELTLKGLRILYERNQKAKRRP